MRKQNESNKPKGADSIAPPSPIAQSRPELFVLCVLLFSFAYFYHPALYDNALSRLDLTYSLVFERAASIDSFHGNTLDKAFHNGHFYCDKAPGLSFAAVPALALSNQIFHFRTPDPGDPAQASLLTLLTVALPCALAFVLLFRILKHFTGSDASAILITLFTALGSICFTYSTQFYGHMFSAALEIAALYIFVTPVIHDKKPASVSIALAGFLLGFAVISDYPSAIPAFFIGLYWLTASRSARSVALAVAGAALPVAALAFYNSSVFGNPLAIGYFKEVSPYYNAGMSKGLGGVSAPDAAAFFKLLFAPQRGLLWGSPFLVFCAPAIFLSFKLRGSAKAISLGSCAAFFSILLLNSAYYEPYGGFSPGPRFLAGAIPFLSIPIAVAWKMFSPLSKAAFAATGSASVIFNFIINAVEPHVPHVFTSPVFQFSIPLHRDGFMYDNLGSVLFSLNGHASFLPLLLTALLSVMYFFVKFININFDARRAISAGVVFALAIAIFTTAGTLIKKPAESNVYISQTWLRQGLVNFKTQRYSGAEKSFRNAIAADPAQTQPYISLAALYLITGNAKQALPVLYNARKTGYNKDVERLLDAARAEAGGKH